MKLLFLGLVPVILFWFVEDHFGTLWGIIAAVAWAIGECAYEYSQRNKIEKLTLFSTALTVGLGGLAAWLNQGILFKFQPVIIELVFAGILIWGGRDGEPLLMKMAKQTRPDVFGGQNPELLQRQRTLMGGLTRNLIGVIVIHCVILSYVAINGTTGQWAFWKGIGFNVFVLIWLGVEFMMLRSKARNTHVITSENPDAVQNSMPKPPPAATSAQDLTEPSVQTPTTNSTAMANTDEPPVQKIPQDVLEALRQEISQDKELSRKFRK